MISGLAFTFVLLPCMAAVAVAAVVRDWRLAAAALCGGLGVAFLAPTLGAPIGLIAMPIGIGAALGALVMVITLLRDPDCDIWSRMLRAIITAFIASFAHLLTFTSGA